MSVPVLYLPVVYWCTFTVSAPVLYCTILMYLYCTCTVLLRIPVLYWCTCTVLVCLFLLVYLYFIGVTVVYCCTCTVLTCTDVLVLHCTILKEDVVWSINRL